VRNFRTDFGAEIDQKGIDAVIQRLEARGAEPPGTKPATPATSRSAAGSRAG
jgi:hypothetical protein